MRTEHQNGAGSMADYSFRSAAEEHVLESGVTVRGDHDEIGIHLFGSVYDFVVRSADSQRRLHGNVHCRGRCITQADERLLRFILYLVKRVGRKIAWIMGNSIDRIRMYGFDDVDEQNAASELSDQPECVTECAI